jgi:hypothetical protein
MNYLNKSNYLYITNTMYMYTRGEARGVVVKALCCKPEGRGFKSR